MERLTKRINGEAVHFDCHGTCGTCDGCTCFEIGGMVDRLAAYEETGLEPEEINAAVSIKAWDEAVEDGYHKAIMELKEYHDLGDIAHLRDLLAAEKDGRLVVLPFVSGCEMNDCCVPEHPEIIENLHLSVAYTKTGIVFSQPYNIFCENMERGYIKPINEEAALRGEEHE